jgi:glycosyltransferase involved in cell wall biosynthesis
MQRTRFPIEIVIGDDYSSDRTPEIVARYQRAFPDIIRVIPSEENVGPNANIRRVTEACAGKYYAMCEGDDYWIDPLKLQKQVEFLETHDDYTGCCHDAIVLTEDKTIPPYLLLPRDRPQALTVEDLILSFAFIPTASMVNVARASASVPPKGEVVFMGDLLAKLWCAHLGKLHYMPEPMSIYRRHPGGLSYSPEAALSGVYQTAAAILNLFDSATSHVYAKPIRQILRKIRRRQRVRSILILMLGPFYPIYRRTRNWLKKRR